MSSAQDENNRDWFEDANRRKTDATYRLIWSWSVPDPFEYARRLNAAWTGRRLPFNRLLVTAVVTGRIAVTLEVGATDATTALAEWGDFPLGAVQDRRLERPRALTLSVVQVQENGRYHPGGIRRRWPPYGEAG